MHAVLVLQTAVHMRAAQASPWSKPVLLHKELHLQTAVQT